jgi:hypothetical protein
MNEGYAMIVGAMMMDGWLQFSQVTMNGGYIAQEVERLMKQK